MTQLRNDLIRKGYAPLSSTKRPVFNRNADSRAAMRRQPLSSLTVDECTRLDVSIPIGTPSSGEKKRDRAHWATHTASLFLSIVLQITQYSAYLWDITTLIPGIPVLAIMVRYNLLSGKVCFLSLVIATVSARSQ